MNRIVGAIYPVPLELISRLFDGKVKVFVKYVAHNTTKLVPKHKIVFYASHGSKEVVGEGTIDKIELLTPNEALEKYGDKLFLNKEELTEYTKHQPKREPSKKMLVLSLSKPRKYPQGIKYKRPITMAGEYLTQEKYSALFEECSP